jgi:8-oxo-dGTP pyrophosphatase MutT (NUDIX family)
MKYCVHFIFKDHKVLLLKRTLTNPFYPGIWTPVVGKIKPNEKPILAVVRETKEETQLQQENPQFVKRCTFDNDEYWFYQSKTKASDISLNHENDYFDFFEKDNLPENLWSFFKTELNNLWLLS